MAPTASSAPVPWDLDAWLRLPLVWPLAPSARAFAACGDWPSIEACDAVLSPRAGVRFVEQTRGPRTRGARTSPWPVPYDTSICELGAVPTRPRNAHDFWNALVWSAFPRAKRRLHERQYRARLSRATGATAAAAKRRSTARTREEDGLALVDEGGLVLLSAPARLAETTRALVERRTRAITEAASRGDVLGVVFGHAVYEHLARAAPTVRATAIVAAWPGGDAVAAADDALARALADPGSFGDPARFASLPVEAEVLGAPRAAR